MLSDYIAPEFVSIDNESVTYQEAIVFAGKALLDAGYITQDYIDAMIEIAEHSKYIVICPKVAMPHAKSESGVLRDGISISKLRTPVKFFHPEHDPVSLVIVLAGKNHNSHLELLGELSVFLDDEDNIREILSVTTKEELLELISRNGGNENGVS